jgi:hypothetical protein
VNKKLVVVRLVFLQGVLQKVGGSTWCFCGEVVVDCVANRGELVVTFAVRKMGQLFQLYF